MHRFTPLLSARHDREAPGYANEATSFPYSGIGLIASYTTTLIMSDEEGYYDDNDIAEVQDDEYDDDEEEEEEEYSLNEG